MPPPRAPWKLDVKAAQSSSSALQRHAYPKAGTHSTAAGSAAAGRRWLPAPGGGARVRQQRRRRLASDGIASGDFVTPSGDPIQYMGPIKF